MKLKVKLLLPLVFAVSVGALLWGLMEHFLKADPYRDNDSEDIY